MLSGIYLAVNVLALLVLVVMRYYRAWPLFVAFQASNCLQILALLCIDPTDRYQAIHYWGPAGALWMLATLGAAYEVLWRSMRGMPAQHKWGVSLSLAGALGISAHMVWYSFLDHYTDWWLEVIRTDRVAFQLSVATLALFGWGILHTVNRTSCPRYFQLHGAVFGILTSGQVYFGDFSRWQHAHALYRGLELACMLGAIVNADLLRRQGRLSGLPEWQFSLTALPRAWSFRRAHLRATPAAARCAPAGLPSLRTRASENSATAEFPSEWLSVRR